MPSIHELLAMDAAADHKGAGKRGARKGKKKGEGEGKEKGEKEGAESKVSKEKVERDYKRCVFVCALGLRGADWLAGCRLKAYTDKKAAGASGSKP